jgi:aspartate-semialdehyde dehydrogenase
VSIFFTGGRREFLDRNSFLRGLWFFAARRFMGDTMIRVGFVGWRGMVGSVLIERMLEDNDFAGFEPLFFSTSQAGQSGPPIGIDIPPLADAYDIKTLSSMDIIVTCQGGDYTGGIYGKLRAAGWGGCWIDAASTLRMEKGSMIVLDPVNRAAIEDALAKGIKDYIGGNCTVSLMLMALSGLFRQGLVRWITSMTYQAASGAGANNMRELIAQMRLIGSRAGALLDNPSSAILELDRNVKESMESPGLPVESFNVPLAGSLIPWIDKDMQNGQSREELKGFLETNKILGSENNPVPVDGICVRISSMRCHSQALTIKLTEDIPLDEIEDIILKANEWVRIIPNQKEISIRELTPARVTGTLSVPVGRIRRLKMDSDNILTCFTVGDQLLWGAAEPVKRMLKIALEHLRK